MNEQDYKAIAEIYKLRLNDIRGSNVLDQEEKDLVEYHILALINAHSDYFGKEGKMEQIIKFFEVLK